MTSGLDRHRNQDGEITRKHGNTLVGVRGGLGPARRSLR